MTERTIASSGGTFPDVFVASDGAIWVLWHFAATGRLPLTRNGILQGTLIVDSGAQFARFASPDGARVGVLYRNAQNVGRLVSATGADEPITLTVVTGNQPFAASASGFAWQDAASGTVRGAAWGGTATILRSETRPTGLSRLIGMAPKFVDEEPDGNSRQPVWSANGAVLVEKHPAGGVKVTCGSDVIVLRQGQDTFDPRVSGPDAAGVYYIVAWGDGGVIWQWSVTAADFAQPQPPQPTPNPIPEPSPMADHRDVVERIANTLENAGVETTGTAANVFEVTKRVAWELRAEVGLLHKANGENIVSWRGDSFSAGRVCTPQGIPIKIQPNVPNGPGWQWAVGDAPVPSDQHYVAAMEPDAVPSRPSPQPQPTPTPTPTPTPQPPAPTIPRVFKAHIRAINGQYLVAEGGGGHEVNANRTSAGPWEEWTIEIVG